MSEVLVFVLTIPIVVGILLVLLNVFVTLVAISQVPAITRSAATVTAAAGTGTGVVPYVPSGGRNISAQDYLRAQVEATLFVDRVDSVECGIPVGSGEALSIARCSVTFHPIVIGARIFSNDVYQLFGGAMTISGEDIAQTGSNTNVH